MVQYGELIVFVTTGILMLQVSASAPPLEPTPRPISNFQEESARISAKETSEQLSSFRNGFSSFEKRIRLFIDNVRQSYLSNETESRGFFEELRTYQALLPANETVTVEKFRDVCYCEGRRWSPCPDRCLDSCRLLKDTEDDYLVDEDYYINEDNCTTTRFPSKECWCYEGSNKKCDNGQISNCYEVKINQTPNDKRCSELRIDTATLKQSYVQFTGVLLEPLKTLVRHLDFQLTTFRESVILADLLANITEQLCQMPEEGMCVPEAVELLSHKSKLYSQIKKNITLEMIKIQDRAEAVNQDLYIFKEQIFAQMSRQIKSYACCLKGFDFNVKNNECTSLQEISASTPASSSSSKEMEPTVKNRRCYDVIEYPSRRRVRKCE